MYTNLSIYISKPRKLTSIRKNKIPVVKYIPRKIRQKVLNREDGEAILNIFWLGGHFQIMWSFVGKN